MNFEFGMCWLKPQASRLISIFDLFDENFELILEQITQL